MKVIATVLQCPKTEHDNNTNEDAYALDPALGVFAIADGVGTASFSNIWSRVLVNHLVKQPLLSSDPFEVEWWLRAAQAKYEADKELPTLESLPDLFRQKAREGSLSTLAAMSVEKIDNGNIKATGIAVGDSCIIVRKRETDKITSFPLQDRDEFGLNPICLPTKLGGFDREFHVVQTLSLELATGDTVILATDAVAKWIIGGAIGNKGRRTAFDEVTRQTPEQWQTFIEGCRKDQEVMLDDDSTALVLKFTADDGDGESLSQVTVSEDVVKKRRQDFENAVKNQDKELIAVYYGDGSAFNGYESSIGREDIARAREVAKALNAVRMALRMALRQDQDPVRKVEPVWRKYAEILAKESSPGAVVLRKSLGSIGLAVGVFEEVLPSLTTAAPNDIENKAVADELTTAIDSDDDEQILRALARLPSDYSPTQAERVRIELAKQRVTATEHVRRALVTRDDEQIDAAYQPILDDYQGLTAFERDQMQTARKRLHALANLQQTLEKTEDVSEILASYDPILDGYTKVSQADRDKVEFARCSVEIANRVQKVIESNGDECDKDERIVRIYDQKYYGGLTEQQYERVRLAEKRFAFRKAIQANEPDDQIIQLYHSIPEEYREITGSAKERLDLALKRQFALVGFRQAYCMDDDEKILASYDSILDEYPNVKPDERERLELARKRSMAIETLNEAMKGGKNTEIVEAARDIPRDYPRLSRDDLARIELARRWEQMRVGLHELLDLDDGCGKVEPSHDFRVVNLADPELISDLTFTDAQFQCLLNSFRRMAHLFQFRRALKAGNDESIAKAYSPLLECSAGLSDEEIQQGRAALTRQTQVLRFQQAVERDDDKEIRASFGRLSDEQRQRLKDTDIQRAQDAELRLKRLAEFRSACAGEDNERILDAYEALPKDYDTLTPADFDHVTAARAKIAQKLTGFRNLVNRSRNLLSGS